MKKIRTQSVKYIDPVCFMQIVPGRHNLKSTYQMRTYYFCAESCRRAFEQNPTKYLKPKVGQRKSLWKRYLDRLNKVTDGKPPSCCH